MDRQFSGRWTVSCPDIEEFYAVLPLRKDYPGIELIRQCSKVSEFAANFRSVDRPSLSVFHGKTKSYVEVHSPYTFDPDLYS